LLQALDPNQRLAALSALALAGSRFLPWWRDPLLGITYVGVRRLTFLEVALFLVALAVLLLLFGRAEGRAFHLPLADGTLIAAAGAWASLLVIIRMLDPPSRTLGHMTRDYGVRFGAVFALLSAISLAAAGARARRKQHPGMREALAADVDATPTLPMNRPSFHK
jgi:hypothetical protein